MNLSSTMNTVSNVLDSFYFDLFDINRRTKVVEADGSTKFSFPSEPLYSDVKCSISYKMIDNPNSEEVAKNPQVSIIEIFTDKNVDVVKGDTIVAHKYDWGGNLLKTYKGIANEAVVYPTHKQIQIAITGNA